MIKENVVVSIGVRETYLGFNPESDLIKESGIGYEVWASMFSGYRYLFSLRKFMESKI
jgi:hypothetical protein